MLTAGFEGNTLLVESDFDFWGLGWVGHGWAGLALLSDGARAALFVLGLGLGLFGN